MSRRAAQLSIGLFLLGFALAQLACGPLSDRFGRRPVLLAGLGLFAAVGLGCAAAPTLPTLLACRVLQGIGACAGTVLARAIIRDLFSGEEAAAKLSQATAIMALGPIVAPALGAVVLAVAGWRAIFLLLGAGGLVLLLAVAFGLAETIPAKDGQALAPRALARNAAGFFGNRQALGNALVVAFLFGGMFAYVAASPFALMEALGIGTAAFSGLFALTAFGIMAGALAGPRLVRAAGRRPAVLGGLVLGAAAGAALLALALVGRAGLPAVIALVALYTFTRGMVVPAATAAAMEPMGHAAGLASGLLGALQMAGAALAASASACSVTRWSASGRRSPCSAPPRSRAAWRPRASSGATPQRNGPPPAGRPEPTARASQAGRSGAIPGGRRSSGRRGSRCRGTAPPSRPATRRRRGA